MSRRPSCSPRHRKHCSAYHAALVEDYRYARDARDALRESGTVVSSSYAAGAAGATVTAGALEDEEFAAAFPPILFRDWLIDHAGQGWSTRA